MWFVGTLSECNAVLTRIRTRLSLPRAASPLSVNPRHALDASIGRTVDYDVVEALSDGTHGFRIRLRVYNHLTAAMQAKCVASLPPAVRAARRAANRWIEDDDLADTSSPSAEPPQGPTPSMP